MICPHCHNENPAGARFCNFCGKRLPGPCPNCGHENPPGSNFCNNCGYRLSEGGAPLPVESPGRTQGSRRRLIPDAYAAKLESARASRAMVGERRIVTMLFCDVKDSTFAAGQLDPEEWAEIINQAFETMIAPVYRYEGIVARLMGDAILAFFGAPVAHEDDPQRAILAGLDIVAGIAPLKDQVARDWGLNIDVRVGINTGLVMVGQVGSDLQMEYTALGDAINLAARMEQTAAPGTVQVSAQTYERIAPLFEFEDLGEIDVKGKGQPVHTFRPLRPKRLADLRREIAGLASPLVGRAAELAALNAALAALRKGNGSIVFLLGEAGLGKSRLVQEVASAAAQNVGAEGQQPVLSWYESSALSYEAHQPYALFQRLLRRLWGISPDDPLPVLRGKIETALLEQPDEQAVFKTLLGLESQEGSAAAAGEAYKRDLYQATTHLWQQETTRRPAVIVFDDLHWVDPASVELLVHLFTLTEHAPLLLLCVMRPDRDAPGWRIKLAAEEQHPHRVQAIHLHALAEQETAALVDNLLAISDLPPQLRRRILEKTDGNPLFVEELVRTLIDRGYVIREAEGAHWHAGSNIQDLDIPSNLQTLLMSRIDRLEEAARHTLQLAAVIGRSFYYRVLAAIDQANMTAAADLDEKLLILQRKELIRQEALLPEPEYLFRHALTQEAAYNTILLRERRAYHRRVGEAIAALFPERLEDFYAVLANHFENAGDPRAIYYAILAGDTAFRLFAITEALSHYTRALELIRPAGSSVASIQDEALSNLPGGLTRLYLRRGRCLELQSAHRAAQENYAELEASAREGANQEMLLAALMAQAALYAIPTPVQDAAKGQALADEALLLARELGDQRAEARLLWIFMLIRIYSGFMPAGIPYGEQAVAMARSLEMQELLAYSLQDLGLAYMSEGRLGEAGAVTQEAGLLWESANNLVELAENRANASVIHVMTADFNAALAFSDEAFRIAQSIENDWGQVNARVFVGLIYIARGQVDDALELLDNFIADAVQVGHPAKTLGWFYLGWLYAHLGAHDQARQAADKGLESSAHFAPFNPLSQAMMARQHIRSGDFAAAALLLAEAAETGPRQTLQLIDLIVDMVTAEYHLAQRDFVAAEENLAILLTKLHQSGARYFLADALRLQARLQQEQGQVNDMLATLQAARETAAEIDARLSLWPVLAELGEETAAREIVDFIANNIGEVALRRTFLDYARREMERYARG